MAAAMAITDMDVAALRLWQLISPALPVGAYAYSQGQETAVAAGWIDDEAGALDWIGGLAEHSVARLDLPVLQRLYGAWQAENDAQLLHWSRFLLASRESSEIRAEDQHLGRALARLLVDLDVTQAEAWRQHPALNYPLMFSLAAVHWHIELRQCLAGYLWAWCENQVAAAIKLVPLGQTAGQRLLSTLIEKIPAWVDNAIALDDEAIGVLCPGLAMASARHETQYSRLFRS
mgnify:CR=1 FL=1